MAIFQDTAMCTKSDQTSGRLRVTQAYIALLGHRREQLPAKNGLGDADRGI